jgi:quercetin dioxygenase-like cupin family protein
VTEQTVLGAFDLDAEIARFPPGEGASGRRAETLIKGDRLRLVLVTMRAGATLDEHTAPGPITIQTLRGRFLVTAGDQEQTLPEGGLIAIAAGARHAVRALDAGAFLLTIAWPGATDRA